MRIYQAILIFVTGTLLISASRNKNSAQIDSEEYSPVTSDMLNTVLSISNESHVFKSYFFTAEDKMEESTSQLPGTHNMYYPAWYDDILPFNSEEILSESAFREKISISGADGKEKFLSSFYKLYLGSGEAYRCAFGRVLSNDHKVKIVIAAKLPGHTAFYNSTETHDADEIAFVQDLLTHPKYGKYPEWIIILHELLHSEDDITNQIFFSYRDSIYKDIIENFQNELNQFLKKNDGYKGIFQYPEIKDYHHESLIQVAKYVKKFSGSPPSEDLLSEIHARLSIPPSVLLDIFPETMKKTRDVLKKHNIVPHCKIGIFSGTGTFLIDDMFSEANQRIGVGAATLVLASMLARIIWKNQINHMKIFQKVHPGISARPPNQHKKSGTTPLQDAIFSDNSKNIASLVHASVDDDIDFLRGCIYNKDLNAAGIKAISVLLGLDETDVKRQYDNWINNNNDQKNEDEPECPLIHLLDKMDLNSIHEPLKRTKH